MLMVFIENIHISVDPTQFKPMLFRSTVPGENWRDSPFSSLPSHVHAAPLKWQQAHIVMLRIRNSLQNEYSPKYQ